MIRRLIMLMAAVLALAVAADYVGVVKKSVLEKKPAVLEIRDSYVMKMPRNIERNSF